MNDNTDTPDFIKEIGFVRQQVERIDGFRRSLNAAPIKLDPPNENGQVASEESEGNLKTVGPQKMTADIVVTNVDETGTPTSNEAPHVTVTSVKNDKDQLIPVKGGALPQKGGNELTPDIAKEIEEALSDIILPDGSELKTKVDALVGKLNKYEDGADLAAIFEAADQVKVEAEKAEAEAEAKANDKGVPEAEDAKYPTGQGNPEAGQGNGVTDAEVEGEGKGGGKRRSRRRRRHSSKKKKKKKSRRRKGSRRK